MAVGADLGAVLVQEVEATARQAALEQDLAVYIGTAVDLRVLGQVGQHQAVLDARLDLGVDRVLVQGLADRLLEPVEPLALDALMTTESS
jgi:hypothetical protein